MPKYLHLHLVGTSGQISPLGAELWNNRNVQNSKKIELIRYVSWTNSKFETHYYLYISSLYSNTASSIIDHCMMFPAHSHSEVSKMYESNVNHMWNAFYNIYDSFGNPTLDDVRIDLLFKIH
jgi:hypothetical protein